MATRGRAPRPPAAPDVDTTVRQRIRALRTAKGWSLEDLARRCLVNASTISRIETGTRRLALDQLAPIARALDSTVDDLIDTSAEDDVVIRPQRDELGGHTYWQLSRENNNNGLSVVKMRITPTEGTPELKVHPGRDWFFVLTGSVSLHLGERQILVHAGQAADFATMTPHAVVARHRPAELISIFDQGGRRAHT